jgi:peptidoglycan/xylan/chitin deacetylase (PgdA/CDA1 family)
VTHPQLSLLGVAEQRAEIEGGRLRLEELTGAAVDLFAYPYGRGDDFDAHTLRVVREAGFRAAMANLPGVVTLDTDAYRVPRMYVLDWDGNQFARRLDRWLFE